MFKTAQMKLVATLQILSYPRSKTNVSFLGIVSNMRHRFVTSIEELSEYICDHLNVEFHATFENTPFTFVVS